MQTIESRLSALGIVVPQADPARGRYRPAVRDGQRIWLAGQGPTDGQRLVCTGKLGAEVSIDDGKAAARRSMLNLLAQLRLACGGSLDQVERCLSVTVYVASATDFYAQPQVADGATGLLAQIWGEEQLPARSAVGVAVLPMNIAVEVDAVFLLR